VFGVPRYRLQAPITERGDGAIVVCGVGVTVNELPTLTRDLAAHAAGVKPDTVTMWASRGYVCPQTGERRWLAVAERDWRGRPLYAYADVMAAERATRRRGRRRDGQWVALDVNSSGMRRAG
jgi:hypothetical protein